MRRRGRRLKRKFHPTARRRRITGMAKCPARALKPAEIKNDYEANTGLVIVETFKKLNPLEHPAVLVASHGPFTWGRDVDDAVHNAACWNSSRGWQARRCASIRKRSRCRSVARQTFSSQTRAQRVLWTEIKIKSCYENNAVGIGWTRRGLFCRLRVHVTSRAHQEITFWQDTRRHTR
jgi:hypothetical protein